MWPYLCPGQLAPATFSFTFRIRNSWSPEAQLEMLVSAISIYPVFKKQVSKKVPVTPKPKTAYIKNMLRDTS